MSIVLKAICRYDVIPVKFPMVVFMELKHTILKTVWNRRRPQRANAILRKNKAGGVRPPDLKRCSKATAVNILVCSGQPWPSYYTIGWISYPSEDDAMHIFTLSIYQSTQTYIYWMASIPQIYICKTLSFRYCWVQFIEWDISLNKTHWSCRRQIRIYNFTNSHF